MMFFLSSCFRFRFIEIDPSALRILEQCECLGCFGKVIPSSKEHTANTCISTNPEIHVPDRCYFYLAYYTNFLINYVIDQNRVYKYSRTLSRLKAGFVFPSIDNVVFKYINRIVDCLFSQKKGCNRMEGVTKIKDLTPESRSVNILAKVLSKSEPKAIQTKFGEEKSVTEVYVGDDTGKVILSLWGDQAAQTSDGQVIYIDNGYVSLVRGHIRLNVGKYGSLKPSDEEIGEVNNELDVSEAEHENTYRKRFNRSYGNNNRGNRNYRDRNDEN